MGGKVCLIFDRLPLVLRGTRAQKRRCCVDEVNHAGKPTAQQSARVSSILAFQTDWVKTNRSKSWSHYPVQDTFFNPELTLNSKASSPKGFPFPNVEKKFHRDRASRVITYATYQTWKWIYYVSCRLIEMQQSKFDCYQFSFPIHVFNCPESDRARHLLDSTEVKNVTTALVVTYYRSINNMYIFKCYFRRKKKRTMLLFLFFSD